MARYRIRGEWIGKEGLLVKRLIEGAYTGVNQLPGVLVSTGDGLFYSELYTLSESDPIKRSDLNEELQGLVEFTTKEMAYKGWLRFSTERSI